MGSLLGFIFGMLTLFVPSLFWPKEIPRLPSQLFFNQYPDKKWLYYIHFGLPFFWIILYLIVISPVLWRIGDDTLYLLSFMLGGGLAVGHGIIEIISHVSMRNFSRGGQAIYVSDVSIRRFGLIRIGFVLLLGLVPLAIFTYPPT